MFGKQTVARNASRMPARLAGTIATGLGSSTARLRDISHTGICLELHASIEACDGQTVTFESAELGVMAGRVTWRRGNRVGVKLAESSNVRAQVSSFEKYFRHAKAVSVRATPRRA